MDQPQYRIVGARRMVREYGYAEASEQRYNILQVRLTNPLAILLNMGRWKNVEEERVPSFAWIQSATLGSTDWKSDLFEKHQDKLEKSW